MLSQIHRTLPAAPLHNRAFGVRIADKHHAALADNADLLAVGGENTCRKRQRLVVRLARLQGEVVLHLSAERDLNHAAFPRHNLRHGAIEGHVVMAAFRVDFHGVNPVRAQIRQDGVTIAVHTGARRSRKHRPGRVFGFNQGHRRAAFR